MSTKIIIKDLIFSTLIGIHDHEKKSPQRIRINCVMELHEKSRIGDDAIGDTVCYDKVRSGIINRLGGSHTHLAETAAEEIAAICLGDKRVRTATVRVEKLDVFADCESVGVEIIRTQNI